MTVSSLWNVLDESKCGRPVGIECFPLGTTLAVDTSIWICEALTSTALSSFHSDPVLYLIYQRTTKLLKRGLGLIFVLEGDRRISNDDGGQELRKRRSGSQFFAATSRCETLLRMLGVPVVRAEANGEALCSLLNTEGIVQGVISNDSDCLLFGCQVVYKNFTLEHLENRTVMRYDADRLRAAVDGSSSRSITLSREDLVTFALLAGSDMTAGISNVGHKKAIAFLDACRSLTQQPDEGTCLAKLLTWGEETTKHNAEVQIDVDNDGPSTKRTCSLCLHPGSKDLHERNGCTECGTSAGEGCFVVTSMEKIVSSIQQKIAKMQHPPFAPRAVVDAYFSPNGNTVPNSLDSVKSATCIASPAAAQLFQSTLILKGASLSSSLDYVRQTLPQLLARLDLLSTAPRNVYATINNQKYKPIPVRVEKMLVRKSVPCYEVIWAIAFDKPVEQQIQFSTHEFQSLINAAFPRLVEAFHREEREKQRGLIEQERHKKFVGTNKPRHQSQQQREKQFNRSMKPGQGRKRERHFDVHHFRKPRVIPENSTSQSADVAMLMDHMRPMKSVDEDVDECELHGAEDDNGSCSYGQNSGPIRLDDNQGRTRSHDKDSATETFAGDCAEQNDSIYSSDDDTTERDTNDISLIEGSIDGTCDEENHRGNAYEDKSQSLSDMPSLSPNQERIFCNLGMYVVECTPIRRSNIPEARSML